MKKVLTMLIVGLALSLGLFASGKQEVSDSGKKTLTVWAWDVALKQLEDAANEFKKTNPDVEFVFEEMGTDQIYTKLSTSLTTKSGLADIILVEGEQLNGFVTNFPDSFVSLDNEVNESDFLPVKVGEVKINGKIQGFPWDAGPMAMFYRTDYFEQAGVKAEDIVTWDDFIEAGKKVTALSKTPSGKSVKMIPIKPTGANFVKTLMLQLGQGFFDENGNTILNSANAVKAMEMEKKIYDAGIVQNYSSWDEYEGVVVNENVATIAEAVWMIGTIKDKGPSTAGKWGVMELPKFNADDETSATNGGSVVTITAQSKNVEVAKSFVKFALTDKQLQANGFVNYGLYPSYIPSYDMEIFDEGDDFFGGQKIYKIFIESGKSIPSVNFTSNYSQALDAVGNANSNVILKDLDIKEALDVLQNDLVRKIGK